jgi:hypothetical protein
VRGTGNTAGSGDCERDRGEAQEGGGTDGRGPVASERKERRGETCR